MAKTSKSGKRSGRWLRDVLEGLRSRLTWTDLTVGVFSAALLSALLIGYRFQAFPAYEAGEIASQNIRAPQDLAYEDRQATAAQRQAARERIPAVYELDLGRIMDIESRLSEVLAAGRRVLSDQKVPDGGSLSRARQDQVLEALGREIGETAVSGALRVLLEQRFSPALENKILRVLDTILRNGIVADAAAFRNDLGRGVVLRDRTTLLERPLTEFSGVRSLDLAKEYLRQFHLEFPEVPARSRAEFFAFLEGFLSPTLSHNTAETAARREGAAFRVPPVEVQLKRGEAIVRAGATVTPRALADLAALQNLQRPRSLLAQLVGFFFFTAVFLYGLWHYFVHHQTRHRKIRHHTVLAVTVLTATVAVIRVLTWLANVLSEQVASGPLQDPFNLYYAIPFSMGAILVTMLVDTNVALMMSTMVSILVGLFYGDAYLAAYAMAGSLAGVYSIRQYKERLALVKSGITVAAVSLLAIPGIHLIRQDSLGFPGLLAVMAVATAGGLLASFLCPVLLPALETLFRVTTDIRLLELSNLNSPVLRRLAVEAPGTYHHSLVLGTLAEAAAESIGANPLLVRVAAYYHDIGKMLKPEYFLENQAFGVNKHEALTPSMSCLILVSHIKDGIELARGAGLTQAICDMIPQHHGTRVMTYFYQKAKESSDARNGPVDERDFRYPGPKPQTKEAAILMMADAVEAASRTLTQPSAAQIQGMVDRLVDDVVADNQLDECNITLREIRLVKESFFKILSGTYHRRIDYPGYDFKQVDKKPDTTALARASSQ